MTQTNTTSIAIEASDEALLAGLFADLGGDDEVIEEVTDDSVGEFNIEALSAEEEEEEEEEEEDVSPAAAAEMLDAELLAIIAADLEPESASEDAIEAAVAGAELEEAKHKLYAEQEIDLTADSSAPVTNTAAVDAAEAKDAEGDKKPKKAKTPKEPKEPKAARASSVTHKPGDLLKIKLGEKASDFLVFSMSDAMLPADVLATQQQEFVDRLNGDTDAEKVKEKLAMFLMWLKNGGTLNTVMARALTVLADDGHLTSGDKGNLQQNLLAKPLSIGTARSQSNQIFMLFPLLGLTVKGKGSMVPCLDSTLLPMAMAALGLAFKA